MGLECFQVTGLVFFVLRANAGRKNYGTGSAWCYAQRSSSCCLICFQGDYGQYQDLRISLSLGEIDLRMFRRLSLLNQLGAIGSIASIVGLAVVFYPKNNSLEAAGSLQQSGVNNTQVQNNGGTVNLLPPTTAIDIKSAANSFALVALTKRDVARSWLPTGNLPKDFLEAERHFRSGREAFLRDNFRESLQEYSIAIEKYDRILIEYER